VAEKTGLLLDFGGVLTTDLFASFATFCEAEGIEADAIAKGFREDAEARDLLIQLETGKIDEDGFEPRFAEMLGVAEPEGLIERLMAGARPDHRMLNAVRAAHDQGVPTGLVSNSWGTRRYDRPMLREIFDGIVISGEVGIRKPSKRIYLLGAESIGVPAESCVFVDDLDFNLKPAEELGMAGVHHTSADDTLPQLERLLGVKIS
jgi:putative hydrolase of the HAD superfamily